MKNYITIIVKNSIFIFFSGKFLFHNKLIIPKPHKFVDLSLESTTAIEEYTQVILKINELLPQLSDFIDQFHLTVSTTNVNVVTDASGNMFLDSPENMPQPEVEKLSKKIGIIDRLITIRGQELDSLLQKGLNLEDTLKKENPKFHSAILEKVKEFNRLNDSYKH